MMQRNSNALSTFMFYALTIIPFFYASAQLTNLQLLYGLKDILFLLIFLLLLLASHNKVIWLSVAYFLALNIYGLILSNESLLLYILSVRELLFYPLLGILAGSYISKNRSPEYVYRFLKLYTLFTLLFGIVFVEISYGPTNRLSSFWDREHEPGIIAAITIIFTVYSKNRALGKIILISICVLLILLSGSRSALVAVIMTLVIIEAVNLNFSRVLLFVVIAITSFIFFETLTVANRSIDHNLIARILQYELAWISIKNSSFLGIGPDKYGVLGNYVVEYCYSGMCTTTMDSSIIKYVVNYGLFFVLIAIWLLYRAYIFSVRSTDKRNTNVVMGVFYASLIFGLLTGKLGAFPLNIIFYMTIGIILQLGATKSKAMEEKI